MENSIFDFGLLHLEWTNVIFTLVVFSASIFLLHILLFRPVIRTIQNRENYQGSGENKIIELQHSIDNAAAEIISLQKNSSKTMLNYRAKQMQEVKQIADGIIQSVRKKLDDENQEFRHQLKLEIDQLELNIDQFSDNLVAQLKQKI